MSTNAADVEERDLPTERLFLRSWTDTEIAHVLNGERCANWAQDFPAEGDRVIAGLIAANAAWLGPFGHRLVVERTSELVVGSIGLFWPPEDGTVEIGYGIVPSARGRGYAAEAVRALTAHAFTSAHVDTVSAQVELSNTPSVRVLENAGFRCTAADVASGTAVFEIVASDELAGPEANDSAAPA